MSTARQSTRASSAAANGPTPALGPNLGPSSVPPTPARATPRRRRSAAPLPPLQGMPPRISHNYGTNDLPMGYTGSGSYRQSAGLESIRDVLQKELQPNVRPSDPTAASVADSGATTTAGGTATPGGRRRGRPRKTPSVSKSFQEESALFGNANLESSSIVESPAETPATRREHQQIQNLSSGLEIIHEDDDDDDDDQTSNIRGGAVRGRGTVYTGAIYVPGGFWGKVFSWKWITMAALVVAVFSTVLGATKSGDPTLTPANYYMFDGFKNILPSYVSSPSRWFEPAEIRTIFNRLDAIDASITYLRSRSDIDKASIDGFRQLLPDFITLEKDKAGNPTIPASLWYAIRSKIRADASLSRPADPQPPISSGSSKPGKETGPIPTAQDWERWLTGNKARLRSWAGEEFDELFPVRIQQLIKDSQIASRDEVSNMIARDWDRVQLEVKTQVRSLAQGLERQIADIAKQPNSISVKEVQAIAKHAVNLQMEALTNSVLKDQAKDSDLRINYASKGFGASINPILTSPNYVFPSMNVNKMKRFLGWVAQRPIPIPNSAEAALTSWSEHGDCWCSPANNTRGFGPSLSVIMGHYVFPDQVVVEHYPQASALVPGSTPKDMEMLVFIEDREMYKSIKEESDKIFADDDAVDLPLDLGWVRVATWSYDNQGDSVQAFPVQVDLKNFKTNSAATNAVLFRAKNNWSEGKVPYVCLYRIRLHGDAVQKPEF